MGANTYLTEQERRILENAKVGIAGAGGLGSNVAMLLVRAGMKKLVIADFDTVNESRTSTASSSSGGSSARRRSMPLPPICGRSSRNWRSNSMMYG